MVKEITPRTYEASIPARKIDALAGKLRNFADGIETIEDVKKEIISLKENGIRIEVIRQVLASTYRNWETFTAEMNTQVEILLAELD